MSSLLLDAMELLAHYGKDEDDHAPHGLRGSGGIQHHVEEDAFGRVGQYKEEETPRDAALSPFQVDSPSGQAALSPAVSSSATSQPPSKKQRIDYAAWKAQYPGSAAGEKPDKELQAVVEQRFEYRRGGANINRELKKKKQFRNPSILDRETSKLGLLEIGSNFEVSKFDPTGWPPEAFYDVLMQRQNELLQQEEEKKKKQSAKGTRTIEFREAGSRK